MIDDIFITNSKYFIDLNIPVDRDYFILITDLRTNKDRGIVVRAASKREARKNITRDMIAPYEIVTGISLCVYERSFFEL